MVRLFVLKKNASNSYRDKQRVQFIYAKVISRFKSILINHIIVNPFIHFGDTKVFFSNFLNLLDVREPDVYSKMKSLSK